MQSISRRTAIGYLGGGLCAVPLAGGVLGAVTSAVAPAPAPAATPAPSGLLAPLAVGSRFARWTIASISPLDRGAVTVGVRCDDGHAFRLEILARDPSPIAPRAPGRTERFAIHVANGGDGGMPTAEEQGLAAMTLASILAKSEATVDASGFLTHAERITRHRAGLLGA